MYVLVNDFEPDDRRELEATNLEDARREALEKLQWRIVGVPDKKKAIKESQMVERMKVQIDEAGYDEFLEMYNKWFQTIYAKADIDWDETTPK